MSKTVLSLAQTFARQRSLSVPAALFTSTDAGVLQLMEIINTVGRDVRGRTDWEVLKRRKTFVSLATEDQGLVTSLIGADVEHLIPETIWDNDQRMPVYGPVDDENYQAIKALLPQGPLYEYRVQQGHLLITGGIPAGVNLSVMYKSLSWLQTTSSSGVFVDEITADVNVSAFSDEVMLAGMEYYYNYRKQLDFDSAKVDYEAKIFNRGGVDNVKPIIRMHEAGTRPIIRPAIIVPSGNWNI
jgi:hypothetical protein